jgi:hypothetical protein
MRGVNMEHLASLTRLTLLRLRLHRRDPMRILQLIAKARCVMTEAHLCLTGKS